MKTTTIKDVIATEMRKMQQVIEQMPWEDPVFYANWAAQTRYYVSHSTRLLALGAVRTSLNNQELHQRFLKHAEEEKGHEKLCDLDLKSLGYQKDHFFPEFPGTAALYQTQYYWMEHQNPLAFFGYIFALECLASNLGPLMLERSQAHGPKGTHFLRVHVEEDSDHVEKALNQVTQFPPEVIALIEKNMQQSLSNYARMLSECRDAAMTARQRKVA